MGLHDLFDLLAKNPLMGQEEPDLGDGIRRFLYEAHIVFYRPVSDGVLIIDLKGVRQS
jgi:plasmid stabilization system protein ParE